MSVERIKRATIRDALDFDVRIVTVEAVCQEVTISIHSKATSWHPCQHHLEDGHSIIAADVSIIINLLSLCNPGILHEVLYDGHHNIFAMEDISLSESTGIPGPCVPVTAAVGHIGYVVIMEGWILLWILTKDGVRVVILQIKMRVSGCSTQGVIILASLHTATTLSCPVIVDKL